MHPSFSRRKFLGGAVVAGAATLLSHPAAALNTARGSNAAEGSEDVANQDLVRSKVAKVHWKVEPFPMPDVRLLQAIL